MIQAFRSPIAAALAAMVLAQLAGCEGLAQQEAKYLRHGEALYHAGEYEKARLELQNALQIDPKNVQARFDLAEVQEQLGNWRQAVSGYREVIENSPQHAEAKLHLAKILLMANQVDQAKKLVDEAKAVDGKNPDVFTLEGALLAKQGDTSGAIKQAEAALVLDPKQLNAIMLLSSLYKQTGRADDAVGLLQGGIKSYPKNLALHLALADVYSSQKNTAAAIDQLNDIIRQDPKNLSHRLRLASYYVRLDKKDNAELVLRQAVKDNVGGDEAKLALVRFVAGYHSVEAGVREIQAFINQAPDNYALRFGLASLYLKGGKQDEAEAVYHDIINKDGTGPKGLQARIALAKIFMKDNRSQDALALLNQVLKENATDNDALLLRGMIKLAGRDADGAVVDFRAVQKDQPNSVEVAGLLAKAQVLSGHPDLAQDQLQRALDLEPKNKVLRLQYAHLLAAGKDGANQAIKQINTVLKQDPKDVDALQALFDIQMGKRNWKAAQATAERVKKALPEKAQGAYMLGLAYQGGKQYDAAIDQFNKVLEKNPAAVAPLSALIKIYLVENRPKDALKALDGVIKRTPDNAAAYNLRGEVLLRQRAFGTSVTAFKKASELNAKWNVPYRNLATAYLAKKDTAGAIRAFETGITNTDHDQALVFDLAALYEHEGKHDAAIAQYEDAVMRAPHSPAAANNLAMMLVTYKTDHESLSRARKLVEGLESATNPAYLDTYGWVMYKNGEIKPAVSAFEKAVKQMPDSGLLRYHLGMALYAEGRNREARQNLQRALKDHSGFNGRDEAKATLEKIAGL